MAYYKKAAYTGPSADDRAMAQFTELMIDKIKGLQEDWHKPWLTPGSQRWPRNMDSREYCGSNALMLMLNAEKQGYDVPVYGTFNRITGLNFSKQPDGTYVPLVDNDGNKLPTVMVNKGEKSFPVYLTSFTVVNRDTKEKIPYADYRKLSDEDKKSYQVFPKLNVYNVFNLAAQTNIAEARPDMFEKFKAMVGIGVEEAKDRDSSVFPAMDEMIGKNLWYCPIIPTFGDAAYFSISKDHIVVPEKRQFKSGESFYSTLLHEMNHSCRQEGRLGGLGNGSKFGSNDYSIEELRAELGAAIVAARFGMTKGLKDDSAAYLKSWLENIQESPDFLKTVLNDVKKATFLINSRIDAIQQQIDDYQAIPGQEHEYPDLYDLVDNDGNTMEVGYAGRDPFEMSDEEAPFKSKGRGR